MSKMNHNIFYNKTVDSIMIDFVYEVSLKNLYNADIIYFNIITFDDSLLLNIYSEKDNRLYNTFLLPRRLYSSFIFYSIKQYKKIIKKIYRKVKRYSKNYKLKYKLNNVYITKYN